MVKDVYYGKTLRKSFARYEEILDMPNLLEGMGCPGGCVAGAGTITPVKKSTAAVGKYVAGAKVRTIQDSAAVKRLREVQD